MDIKVQNKYISIVSFFLYSGYYVGLSFFYLLNLKEFSRFYSVPLRLLLSIIMIYVIILYRKNLKKNRFVNILFFLFSFLYVVKVMYTELYFLHGIPASRSWIEYIFYYMSYTVLIFMFFSTIDLKKYKDVIINAIIFSGFLLGILSLFIFKEVLLSGGIGRISELEYETGKEVISPLALAYSGSITIVLCLYKLIYQKPNKKEKIYLYLTLSVAFGLFFLGATRGALVAVLIGLLSLIYFGTVKNRLKFSFLFVLAIPLIIYGVEATGSAIFERSLNTVETGDSSGREPLWNAAIEEFINNPILGGRIEVSGIYPHNIFLEILMATGTVGFIIFLIIMIWCIKNGLRSIKLNKIYLFSLLIFLIGFSMSNFSGAIYSVTIFFGGLGLLSNNNIK